MITLFVIFVIFVAVFKFVWKFIKPAIKFMWKCLGLFLGIGVALYCLWDMFRDNYRALQPGISDEEVFEDIKLNITTPHPEFWDNVSSGVGEAVTDMAKGWFGIVDTSEFKDSVVETIPEDIFDTNVSIENFHIEIPVETPVEIPVETQVETQVSSVEIVDDNTDKVVSETPVESPEFKKVKRGSSRKFVRKSRRNSRRKLRNS